MVDWLSSHLLVQIGFDQISPNLHNDKLCMKWKHKEESDRKDKLF